jgi:predicted dehydrogenase
MRVYLTYNKPGWHGIQTYSGGWLANAGSHALDMVQWALDADGSGPVEVWAEKRSSQSKVTLRYANGVLLKLDQSGDADRRLAKEPGLELASAFGAIFYGDEGFLVMHRGRFNTRPISISQEPIHETDIHLYKSDHHFQNWIDCIRSRRQPAADVEIGHRTCTVCHLANIARWTGRRLRWDPKQEIFPGDGQANALLERAQRAPYQLPNVI